MLSHPSCSSSVASEDLTPDKLPGAASLWPDLVVVPACLGSQCVVRYTMMSSGRQLCSVLPILVLCSQSASSLAFLWRCCSVLAATDRSCKAWACDRPSRCQHPLVAGLVAALVLCRGRHRFGSVQWGLSAIGGPVPASPASCSVSLGGWWEQRP